MKHIHYDPKACTEIKRGAGAALDYKGEKRRGADAGVESISTVGEDKISDSQTRPQVYGFVPLKTCLQKVYTPSKAMR